MDTIPYNKVGNAKPESMADIAENEGISEADWRAKPTRFQARVSLALYQQDHSPLRTPAALARFVQRRACRAGMGTLAPGVGAR